MDFGCGLLLNGQAGQVPIRKLKDSTFGTAPLQLGADRTHVYLLQEERLRQKMWQLNMGVYAESASSDAASAAPYSPVPTSRAAPADEADAWRPASPRGRLRGRAAVASEPPAGAASPAAALVDMEVQCDRMELSDAPCQTVRTLELEEQDELIAYQQVEIKRLKDRIATLKTAALSKAFSIRDELANANKEFIDEHTAMYREEVKKRKVFETAALLSLRTLERERAKDSERAVCSPPGNAYDSKVALLRLSVPDIALPPHMLVPAELAHAVNDVSDYSHYEGMCDYEAFPAGTPVSGPMIAGVESFAVTSQNPLTPVSAMDAPPGPSFANPPRTPRASLR
eukprot:TRINITY_DN22390_c0_g1_i1.p1 TRINITY_DN22390_c0_g1~~TRINITY_DN22390_c0_g1_i1.p1  ORF type:complete len:341 (+),score=104.36 TRINITY_DN22390_c0_g1_i1:53-1075(+)